MLAYREQITKQLGLTLHKRLFSKKNDVYLVSHQGRNCILKIFSPQFRERATKECLILMEARAKGIPVPEVISFYNDNALLLEYIAGDNLCDALNSDPRPEYAIDLAKWYADFHQGHRYADGSCCLKGDSILRNFVRSTQENTFPAGTLYGLDFEESKPGDPASDIGEICASILDTDPMFTPIKITLCQLLIETYEKNTETKVHTKVLEKLVAALHTHAHWRPKQQNYLLHQANLIADMGLTGTILSKPLAQEIKNDK